MTRVGNGRNIYAIKEVFDIYFCNKDKTIYISDTAKTTIFSTEKIKGKTYFVLTITDAVGNIEDWLHLIQDINTHQIKKIYLRSTKRMVKTGEDERLCLKISNIENAIINDGTTCDNNPMNFGMKIYFQTAPIEVDNEENYPEKIIRNDTIGILEGVGKEFYKY